MNPTEANRLLAHAAAFDNRNPSTAAAEAWAAALHDIPFDDDALAAVARFYGTVDPNETGQKWIQPHHVRAQRKIIRAERLEGFQYLPTPGADYLTDLRAQIAAVASGQREAAPALPAGPDRSTELEEMLAAAFSRPPKTDAPAAPQPAETPEETRTRQVAEAYGYLLAIDDEARARAVEQARVRLGPGADRQDVILFAARSTNARPRQARPDKAMADKAAADGCPFGCPLGGHTPGCYFADAS